MTIETIAIIAGVVVLFAGVIRYFVRQRGGDGPPVGAVPRTFRPWVNAWHGLNKWPIPFDRDGELIPVEKRERAS